MITSHGGQLGRHLPDALLASQVLHRPAQERPVGAHRGQDARLGLDGPVPPRPGRPRSFPSCEPVVVGPGGIRDARVEGRRLAHLGHDPVPGG
jgi:hypothetical protein